jgi:PAS domain S-box-containing protein
MTRPAYTLLLIEEGVLDRERYRRYLLADASCAYWLLEADSAAAGLELCWTQTIDAVILLDGGLPNTNRFEFLEALRTQNTGSCPPVVMIVDEENETVSSAIANAVRAVKLGAEDYLIKHYLTPEMLQLTVRRAIENTHLQPQRSEVLQETNQQIITIWESMTDAYITLDREWRIVYANQAAIRVIWQLAEIEPKAFLGKTHWEVFPWARGQIVEQEYRRAVAEQVAVHFEMLYEPSGGWFEVHAYPSIAGLGIYFRDISDRKQIEEALELQLAEIESIYTMAPIGLCFVDTDLRFVRINEHLAELNGCSVAEHLGRTLREVLPEMADQLEPLYRQVIDSGEPILNLELQNTNSAQPDGVCHWLVCYYPQKDAHHQVVGVNVMVQKITDRKHIEEERKQAEEALQQLSAEIELQLRKMDGVVSAVSDFIYTFDLAGRFTYINQPLLDLWQQTLSDSVGKNFFELDYPPELAERLQNQIQHVITTRQPLRDETPYTNIAGTRVYEYIFVPLFDERGAVEGVAGTTRDITARKLADMERSQLLTEAETAREEAEAANRSKDEFVAMVAHELRSPLNSIMGWAKLLQTRRFDEAVMAKALGTIVRNTEAQVQLVEDLLDISRMVRGTLQIQMAPVNWSSVIEAALDLVRPMADAKQIRLEVECKVMPQISGDFNRLQQIAVNLLTNAIKFTPKQGRVRIYLEKTETQAQLRICDTGKGIAPEFLPFIFEQFQQGQQNTGSKDGLGLGLAIVKNLVELHSGTIAAESAGQGQGATFIVRLPMLSAIAPKDDNAPVFFDVTSLAGICILAVDDEPDMLDLITFVLGEFGADVQSALNTADALERLPQIKPNILVSDIAMSEGNGYELLQQIRLLPEGDIPAIALTAYASTTYEERSLQAGFQQHLTKPVETKELISVILSLVGEKKL